MRQGAAAEALGQIEPGVAAALGIDARLDRGRRRGEDHRAPLETPAHHGHVAGVVVDAVLLLVGGLVLLVDDDEAEAPIGQEQGRAGARHHLHLAVGDAGEEPLAPAPGDARMPRRRPRPEAAGEAVEELAREGDLGHQDQGLAVVPHRLGDGLEIDLRLARARHALEQDDRGPERRSGAPSNPLPGGDRVG